MRWRGCTRTHDSESPIPALRSAQAVSVSYGEVYKVAREKSTEGQQCGTVSRYRNGGKHAGILHEKQPGPRKTSGSASGGKYPTATVLGACVQSMLAREIKGLARLRTGSAPPNASLVKR